MAWFEFGRQEGFPSQYLPHHTPVTIDVTETIFIILFVIITLAYFTIVPGYCKERSICVGAKIVFSMLTGCLLIVENFGQEWEIGGIQTTAPYRAGQPFEIKSHIGVKIGLRSVNITLKAKGVEDTPLEHETIDYNERFPWTWDQGRLGFGPYAGLLQRSFREGQRRGLPIPILWVAEYFVIDGEGIRFGRYYRTAGWYCHILLWMAFAMWILAIIFLQSVGRYTAYFIATAGGLQILACIIWVSVHNPTPLIIPFADGAIKMYLGLHFWMSLTCGILCLVLALILVFMDLRYPNALSLFLGIDPLDQYDECILRMNELENIMRKKSKTDHSMEMAAMTNSLRRSRNTGMVVKKRRSTIKNAQRDLFKAPVPVHIENYEDVAVYENQEFAQSSNMENTGSHVKRDFKPPIPKRRKNLHS